MGSPLFQNDTVLDRVRRFNNSLDRLMRLYSQGEVSSGEFARAVTEEASLQLGAQRASAWSLNPAHDAIQCIDLYEADIKTHSSGAVLFQKDFPNYFAAVLRERVITANDARTDERTCEFDEVYLQPNRIFSMLDTQIRSAGGPRGVICIESVDAYKEWSPDEAAYAVSLAELLGFLMDREDRAEMYARLSETNEQLAQAVSEAEAANERFELATTASADGIWDLDVIANTVVWSEQNLKLLGEQDQPVPHKLAWWQERLHPDDAERVTEAVEDHLRNDTPYNVTYRIRHADGSWRWWRSRAQAVRDHKGNPVRVVGTNSDVTDLVEMQSKLEARNQDLLVAKQEIEATALHDSLTNLPNRRFLVKKFEELRGQVATQTQLLAILHIDLDFFKDVNDRFGHAVGDATLKMIAHILNDIRQDDEFVARIGGDEFMAVVFDDAAATRATAFCQKLQAAMAAGIRYDGHNLDIGASVGIAVEAGDDVDVWGLLGNADLALYEAKKLGRKRYCLFDDTLRARAAFVRDTKTQLRSAVACGEQLVPYFQPQYCAVSKRLVGFEVLVRWNHPTRGVLTPGHFLRYAEELDLVAEIDRQIMRKAAFLAKQWMEAGFAMPRLSLNLSSARLVDPDLLRSIDELGEMASYLSFELLETTFLDESKDEVQRVLDHLRTLNIEFDIDDFGSGYASILSLVNVRPARLKIDASLTRGVGEDCAIDSLIASIVNIARALNIGVVAEGVENAVQAEALTELGCEILQGYWLGYPMPSDDVMALLQR